MGISRCVLTRRGERSAGNSVDFESPGGQGTQEMSTWAEPLGQQMQRARLGSSV
jgi:hypothetical protein